MTNSSPEQNTTQRTGKAMLYIAWIIGLGLLTLFFADLEEAQINPNRTVNSSLTDGRVEVVLQQNRWGHYVANGKINGDEVTFLLDTGATVVSVPYHLKDKLNLSKGRPYTTITANGNVTVYGTTISELRLGDLVFNNVRAALNPGMKDDEILLGMSVLADLELTQRGEQMIIRSY
ncbi:MAG: TIGR02281 family clan AA aspartic protease [Porticoccaceae bacterium]|nr:TIGR02281 family clan AA aspartic protease [Pseudomonadales bacterium]